VLNWIRSNDVERTKEEIVTGLKTLVIALGVTMGLPLIAHSEEQAAQPGANPAPPAQCLEAAVNPVTGDAVCVNPVGAAVAPPPKSAFQPCKPRAHDNDAWTTYEHSSGCDQ
jgi:hypothetical protein